jgi:hypothetical protein
MMDNFKEFLTGMVYVGGLVFAVYVALLIFDNAIGVR